MTFHSVVPAPLTILKGVRKLPPASVMTIDASGAISEERYWELKVESTDDVITSYSIHYTKLYDETRCELGGRRSGRLSQ